MPPTVWIVVGGADRGGLIVRRGPEVSSEQVDERLAYGALVEEVCLVGDRLHFKKLVGAGPPEGWLSVRLKSKDLAVRIMPEHLAAGRSFSEVRESSERPEMTFFAISDVHVERKENLRWLEELPRFENSTLILAGDLGVSLTQVEQGLRLFQSKFDHVCYCYGNHETWAKVPSQSDAQIASYADSWEKLSALRDLCIRLGVIITPTLIAGVWIVPVLGWYHTDWDDEPPLQAPPGKQLEREPTPAELLATDSHACKWGELQNGSRDLAERLDRLNELWGLWPLPEELARMLQKSPEDRPHRVITFSHFLPRTELMPEKRFLFQPNLPKIVGSSFVRQRLAELRPELHVFGHTHFPWDMTLDDGIRYRSWPLGTPEEQARRVASAPSEQAELWHPLAVFDSDGHHYRSSESCWFSLMYTRLKRDPLSFHMAPYVAYAYCKDAPTVPDTIISPAGSLEPASEEDRQRRERYATKSRASIHREVKR